MMVRTIKGDRKQIRGSEVYCVFGRGRRGSLIGLRTDKSNANGARFLEVIETFHELNALIKADFQRAKKRREGKMG